MAMHIGADDMGDEAIVSTINTTPLVDVMLVLLIIFLITIPVVTTSVPVQLPKETIEIRETKPDNIVISIDQRGTIFWQDTRIVGTAQLIQQLTQAAARKPQPEIQIRGDLSADYRGVGQVVYACQRAGIVKLAFITEPPARGG
jgi:biopolymer transport protein ExbD